MDVCNETNPEQFLQEFAEDILKQELSWREQISKARPGPIDQVIFILALAGTIFCAFVLEDYMVLWVASTLFIIIFYPLTFLIPALASIMRDPSRVASNGYMKTLKGVGVVEHRDTFLYVLLNAFFINSRPLAIPITLLCVSDIVMAFLLYLLEMHPVRIILIIMTQSAVIVIYYLSIYFLKPYSRAFVEMVQRMRIKIHRGRSMIFLLVVSIGILGLFLSGFVLSTLLFPGITVWEVIREERVTFLTGIFELILIFLIQFVIVRFLHGIFSRRLMRSINSSVIRYVKEEILPPLKEAGGHGKKMDVSSGSRCPILREIATSLIEARMYSIHWTSIRGNFPIFFIQPNLSLILDRDTLEMLKGHMEDTILHPW
jgi:hypothetical protein